MKLILPRQAQLLLGAMLVNPHLLLGPDANAKPFSAADPADANTLVSVRTWFLTKVAKKVEYTPLGDLARYECHTETKEIGLKSQGCMLLLKMCKHYERVCRVVETVEAYERLLATLNEKPYTQEDLSCDVTDSAPPVA